LRLYSLDFLPRRPDAGLDRDGLREALAAFADTYRLLGLGRLKAELAPETVAALFGHAALRRRFALEEGEAEPDHAPNASNQQLRKDRRAVRELADAVARIELWLIGYLARPRRLMEANDDTNKSLPAALRAFWRDQPAEAQPDKRLRNDAIGLFFRQAETITLTTADDDPLGSDEVLRDRLENDPELARQVVAETRSLGARIVDGVRRVARFIGNWIRRRLGGLLALARNIARALIGRTRKVFSAVRQIVSSLRDSWDFVFRKPVPGSDPRQLLVLHDRDFDFTLVAYAGADPARVTGLGRRLAALARLLRLAMSFLRQLTGAFVGVARRFGIGGWFGAVMALLEAGPRIQRMIVLAREMRAQREMLAADLA
jgi:hypothetical protein